MDIATLQPQFNQNVFFSHFLLFSSYLHMVVENKRIIWYNKYKSRVAYLLAI